jgi:hypothetical protein
MSENQLFFFLVAVIYFLIASGCVFPESSSKKTTMKKVDIFKKTLNNLSKESIRYFSIEALEVNFFPEGIPDFPFEDLDIESLSSLETFFLVDLKPKLKSRISEDRLQDAYCAALQHLPGDWWGKLGTLDSPVCKHLLEIPEIKNCLVKQLKNTKPFQHLEGEEATYSYLYHLQVSDLAALFLCRIYQLEYLILAEEEIRSARKNELLLKFL